MSQMRWQGCGCGRRGKRGSRWVKCFFEGGACLFYKQRVQISVGAELLSAIWGGCPPTLKGLSATIVFSRPGDTQSLGIINNGCMPSLIHLHARQRGAASISGHNRVLNDQSQWRLLSFESFGFCWHMQALITTALKGKNRKWRGARPPPPACQRQPASLMNPA